MNTSQRSLASTTLFGGMPMSSQFAVIAIRCAPLLSNTTATLYPERGPAHIYPKKCQLIKPGLSKFTPSRSRGDLVCNSKYAENYLEITFHPNLFSLYTKRIYRDDIRDKI